jgi:sugar O-acyltransferase, sialic acid O-acetyltransferase NeuD family
MDRESIILVGAGGHARSCIDVVEQEGRFLIAGLVGVKTEVGTLVCGYAVLGTDAELPVLKADHSHALVAVGQISSAAPRQRLFEALTGAGWALPAIVSPHAYVSHQSVVGEGTIVMHGAVINAGATVGRNCIINSMALIEHDVVIADHCHVATAAVLNGGVQMGAGTFIGSGTVVREGIMIGEGCLIGMGQRIRTDCGAGMRVAGTMTVS